MPLPIQSTAQHDSAAEIARKVVADLPPLVPFAEVAKVLHRSQRQLHRDRRAKRFRSVQLATGGSSKILVPRCEVQRLVEEALS